MTLELESGRSFRAELRPRKAQFAPGGAKEIFFEVEPSEASGEPALREMVGRLAAHVARAVWGPFLGPLSDETEPAIVDREGGTLRVDLRTAPEVRKALNSRPGLRTAIDAIRIDGFEVDDRGLLIRLALGLAL